MYFLVLICLSNLIIVTFPDVNKNKGNVEVIATLYITFLFLLCFKYLIVGNFHNTNYSGFSRFEKNRKNLVPFKNCKIKLSQKFPTIIKVRCVWCDRPGEGSL